ncbi:MAG: hypothetical protein ACI89X_003739 [Planctomycetota bacterium]|jgi:hypothetical protein
MITLLLAVSYLVGTWVFVAVPLLSIFCWQLLAKWWWQQFASNTGRDAADVRAALSFQIGFVLTMLSLYFVVPNASWHVRQGGGHAPFGEHQVTVYAGFPWSGVEGCPPYAWAQERIPLDMGVDALLVNFACWSAAAFLLMRLPSRNWLHVLIVLSGIITPFAVIAGVLQLGSFFD